MSQQLTPVNHYGILVGNFSRIYSLQECVNIGFEAEEIGEVAAELSYGKLAVNIVPVLPLAPWGGQLWAGFRLATVTGDTGSIA